MISSRRFALFASFALASALFATASGGCAKKQAAPPTGAAAAAAAPSQPAKAPDKDVMPGGGPGGGK